MAGRRRRRATRPRPCAGERYRILRFHREGGLGRVYIARDEELGREVALKEIRPDKVAEADLRGRFVLEAEINGGLEHPGDRPRLQAWAPTTTAGRSTPCGSSRGTASRRPSSPTTSGTRSPTRASASSARLLGRFIDVCDADRVRAQQGCPAPRPEAAQRDAGAVRRDAPDRLGPGQGHRPSRAVPNRGRTRGDAGPALGQRSWPHDRRARLAALHEPRAGRGLDGIARAGDRYLRAGGDPVRPADRRGSRGGEDDGGDPRPGARAGRSGRRDRSTPRSRGRSRRSASRRWRPSRATGTRRRGRWPRMSSTGWPTSRSRPGASRGGSARGVGSRTIARLLPPRRRRR